MCYDYDPDGSFLDDEMIERTKGDIRRKEEEEERAIREWERKENDEREADEGTTRED